ncbi:MAG: 60S ribosomal protein L22 [Candidatus Bathyarchaeia archaeon]
MATKVTIETSELRSLTNEETIKDLKEFLEEKMKVKAELSGSELVLKNEKGAVSRAYVRVLLRKFLHQNELKDDFRVIAGKENSFIIKEKKAYEEE